MFQAVIILVIVFFTVHISAHFDASKVKFIVYNSDGTVALISTNNADNLRVTPECLAAGNFTMTAHGWEEDCSVDYMKDLVANYIRYRGGCVICVDYSDLLLLNNLNYPLLVAIFPSISQVVTDKLHAMESQGVDLLKLLLFGFSYGARLVIDAAKNFGIKRIAYIDACEPAGPLFDTMPTADPTQASNHTMCIHTSIDAGTHQRNCDTDFVMGLCGVSQAATLSTFTVAHRLCPFFYISSFTNNFPAIIKPWLCSGTARDATSWPAGYSMGYDKPNRWAVRGKTLYAKTSLFSPYN